MLKIAVLSSASDGGAGIAAQRMCIALDRRDDVSADFLDISTIGDALPSSVAQQLNASRRVHTDTHFTPEKTGFVRGWLISLLSSYDVINVHWASYLISTSELIELATLGKSILITLHDFYYLTGGCHYPAGCTGQVYSCVGCPQVDEAVFSRADVSAAFHDKQHLLSFRNVHICAPSRFLVDSAVGMGLVPASRAHVVRNIYEPTFAVPDRLGSEDAGPRHILLIAASFAERRKGMRLAVSALVEVAKQRSDLVVHLVGEADTSLTETYGQAGLTLVNHGKVSNHEELEHIYQSVDVILSCSFEDNWPNVLIEAGAYGVVPVVGAGHGCEEFCRIFGAGGIASHYTPSAFATAIIHCLDHLPRKRDLHLYAQAVREVSCASAVTETYLTAIYALQYSCELPCRGYFAEESVVSANFVGVLRRVSMDSTFTIVPDGPYSEQSHQFSKFGFVQYNRTEEN